MLKTIFQSLLTRGGVAIFNFLVLILSSRYLGVETRGEVSVMVLNLAAVQIINEIITGYSLVSFIPHINLWRLYRTGFLITAGMAITSTLVLTLSGKSAMPHIWIIIPLTFVVIANTFNLVVLLGKQDLKHYNIFSILQPFLLLAGLFLTTRIFGIYTFEGYLYPLFLSFLLTFILTTFYALRFATNQNTGSWPWKRILLIGFYCQMAVFMHVLSNRYSYYLLENNAQVGLYASACSLMESVWVIMTALNPIVLSKVANEGDGAYSRGMTLGFAKLSFLLSLAAGLVVMVLPDSLFLTLLGKSFTGIKGIMLAYLPGILFISFSGILAHYFSALGQLKRTLICNSVGFLFTIVAAPLLIRSMGINGALLTANISYGLSSLALLVAFMNYTKLPLSTFWNLKADWKLVAGLLKK